MPNEALKFHVHRRDHLLRHERRRLLADERRQGQAVPRRDAGDRRRVQEARRALHRRRLARVRRRRHVPQPDPNDPEPSKKRKVTSRRCTTRRSPALRDIAKEVAQKNGCAFADVYGTMVDAMTKAKAKYGPKYHVAGGDGVHPAPTASSCMAYAFLKGLGVDGNIGTITVDLAANKAEATDGHKVLGVKQRRGRRREHPSTRSASTATPRTPAPPAASSSSSRSTRTSTATRWS